MTYVLRKWLVGNAAAWECDATIDYAKPILLWETHANNTTVNCFMHLGILTAFAKICLGCSPIIFIFFKRQKNVKKNKKWDMESS